MIGKVPLDQLAKTKGIEVEWKAFELRPEGVEVPEKSPEYYQRAWESVKQFAAQYGLEMKFNRQARHSRKAHEGAKFAIEHGKGNEYHEAVFRSQFQEDENINEIDTLVAIAEEIGLDPTAFRKALDTGQYRPQVLADTELAARYGVTGVPCFVVGNRGAFGVQSQEALERLLEGKDLLLDLE
ncbi:DsbA family oxidoreductase [Effusibacillus consociatus]|uniref:DsbA family protein n=1 Tax=Effusibacillus consociatus TaxID=1117041 RepID=A0ABV9Q4P0_9BACL